MELNAILDFEFKDYSSDMTRQPETHFHRVRRIPEHTIIDKYAHAKLINFQEELFRQELKGWSRSYYSQAKHLEALMNYSIPNIPVSKINFTLYQSCVNEIRTGFRSLPKARAFDVLTELDAVTYKSSTAAGYDYNGAKGPKYGQNHKRAIIRARAIVGDVSDRGIEGMKNVINTMVPDVGYTRTQLTDLTEKTKIRNVWGRSFHYILIEGLTADPLIRMFQRNNTFYHIGRDPLDSVPKVLSEISKQSKWLYAIDWKQFDATVSRFEINAAFDILLELIDFPNAETYTAFEISRQLFIHKKIAAPDGHVYWVHKGIPSGSYFTSIIGSIVNRLRIEYLWRTLTGKGPKVCYTQGDDSISGDDELILPEDFARIANQIGWILNPDKTEYSTIPRDVSFLGRTMTGGMNTRSTIKCLRLLVYPEYEVESGRISAYRARSIAEDAGGLSGELNRIANELETEYGVASEDEVPDHFKKYVI
ncbi:ORF1 [Rhodiola cryptic virus 2]|nr:ORF1 [Rhodiola cryptic virus 2]